MNETEVESIKGRMAVIESNFRHLTDAIQQLKIETKEGFQKLEYQMEKQREANLFLIEGANKRLSTLEQWRSLILGGIAAFATIWGALISWFFSQRGP